MKKYIQGFMRYRYLLKELVYKGIKLKYRRSYLGLVWTLLEPLLTTMVLAFVFAVDWFTVASQVQVRWQWDPLEQIRLW